MAGVPFGTKLLINGTVYTVEDLGTPYGHVDIYCGSHSEALSFGLQSADVYQVGRSGKIHRRIFKRNTALQDRMLIPAALLLYA